MNTEDQKFIDALVKEQKTSLKKRRFKRNVIGGLILLIYPVLIFTVTSINKKLNFKELLQSELFLLGFVSCLFTVVPLTILVIHLCDNSTYDDLKKNDLIVQLHQEKEEQKEKL